MTAPVAAESRRPQVHSGSGILTAGLVFIGRSLRHSSRDVEAMIMAVVLPVVLLVLFTTVFGGAIDGSGQYINYVVPGIIVLCAGFGSAAAGVLVNRDLSDGAMQRFRTMPFPAAGVIIGHVVAVTVRTLIATAVVIGFAMAIGFRPTAGLLDWISAVGLIILWVLVITLVYAFLGMIARSAEAANGYGFILLFLPYLSSAFVAVDTLPGWLQPVARNQPITPLVESLRAYLLGGDAGNFPMIAVAWCLGLLVVGAVAITTLFPRAGRR